MQGDAEGNLEQRNEQPPVIVKKIVRGGHHGGAWKVAYADFVTALMALFIVLWLMNASQQEKEAVAAYFQDPRGFKDKIGSGSAGAGSGLPLRTDRLDQLAQTIQARMKEAPELQRLAEHVSMSVTGEGLRIELLETEKGMFFESGSPAPTGSGRQMLATLAKELTKLSNQVIIEGHTDSRPYTGRENYSNWELSTDRANQARRILEEAGISGDRIVQVRGFADVMLRKPDAPEDPSNRRISLIIRYQDSPLPVSPSGFPGAGGRGQEEREP